MKELQEFLSALPEGPVIDKSTLERLLMAEWDTFNSSNAHGMKAEKLGDRIETPTWSPPFLDFSIERHGATVRGSTRGKVQRWRVDVHAGTAECIGARWRQLQPKQKPLYVAPIADKLLQLILSRREHEWLKWAPDGSVTLQMGRIIPAEGQVEKTLNGRRKRLRNLVPIKLEPCGWRRLRPNTFKRD